MPKDTTSSTVGVADVAREADVSVGTVSNYLNYPDRVSPSLRERIQKAIDRLGYERKRRPKTTGRTRMARTIGLVMSDIEHSLFTSIFEGAQEICEDAGLQLIGMNSYADKERQHEAVRHLCQMHVSGILLSSVHDSSAEIELAAEAGIPLVMIDHSNPPSGAAACTVLEDNMAAGEIAVDELVAAGRRRLLFIGHSRSEFQAISERWLGALRCIERHGGSHDGMGGGRPGGDVPVIRYMDSGGIMMEDGYAVGAAIARMPESERPDGIIAATDFLACGLVNAFVDDGTATVPGDIAVVGLEGDRLDAVCAMPLTVVQAPGNDMGRQAMRQLLADMDGSPSHMHATVSLLPALVRRATTPGPGM